MSRRIKNAPKKTYPHGEDVGCIIQSTRCGSVTVSWIAVHNWPHGAL